MKKLILSILFITLFITAYADPVERGVWKTVKLADGKDVRVELRGDEYMSYWQAENGAKYVRKMGEKYYILADMEKLYANAVSQRVQDSMPKRVVLPSLTAKGKRRLALGESHPAFIGKKKGLIILVEFTDQKFKAGHDAAYYSRVANELNFQHKDGFVGSVHDYFLSQSDGQFDLSFDVVGPIALQNNMAYYGAQTESAHDVNAKAMAKEAAQGAAKILPSFADYDWFGDGYVDQIFIIYAGRGQSSGGGDDTIWPHRSSITRIKLGGKYVQVYACANEMHTDTQVHGIGTFCHEFSHCLGLADLYDTKYGKYSDTGEEFYGMSYWDVMASGAHLNNNFTPCAYSGYERYSCGWKEPIVLTKDTVVTNLKAVNDGGDFFIIYNDAHKDEFFLLENRAQIGWDAAQYNNGLLITHVDYNATAWSKNVVNSVYEGYNDHERYSIFPADNNTIANKANISSDIYPYMRNNLLTNFSYPAATLYNANTDGTFFMSKPITNIVKNSDKSISFQFNNENEEVLEPMPEGVLFRETFSYTSGVGGNNEIWNPTEMSLVQLVPDNVDWTFNIGSGAGKCAILGSNARAGQAETPQITIDSPCELSFKTAAYGAEGSTSLTISVSEGDVALGETQFAMELGKWSEYTTTLSAASYPATFKLTFKNNKRRFFLDEIFVKKEDISATPSIVNASQNQMPSALYNLAGQKITDCYKGIIIKNCKKIYKYKK